MDVSIYPPSKRAKKCNSKPSAPSLKVLFPHISNEAIDIFLYQTQTFPELKELYDTYSLRLVLECINIYPYMWEILTFTSKKEYLSIYTVIDQNMKTNNI